ncbi:MAG: trypsin-like peptidase domain-containing protein [Deltaproteobacteria bacterium]|nr:trypsin-like peptidase domain-containing protein [Deltaproteobacteria bacterium]
MKKIQRSWKIAAILACAIYFVALVGAAVAKTEDEENSIRIYKRVSRAVVNITSTVIERDFFLNPVPREGAGSGSIIDKQGHILTNHHVIKDSQKIEVTLGDGSKWPAKLVGSDPDNDLAVIRIRAPRERLTVIPMGDSDELEVGQKVLAIGNPFGLGQTLTTGIISSLGRRIRAEGGALIEDVIQTDAAINPGNSGGPLLDSDGRIIGVNSAIISPTGASIGIGFAIPVNTVKRVLPDLIEKGYVSYPWIGASVYPLIPEFAEVLGLKVKRGAIVAQVIPGAPAERAGLRGATRQVVVGNSLIPVGGDVIVAMDGKEVDSADTLIRMIRERRPGDRIKLKVLRGDKFIKISVTLGERPRQR